MSATLGGMIYEEYADVYLQGENVFEKTTFETVEMVKRMSPDEILANTDQEHSTATAEIIQGDAGEYLRINHRGGEKLAKYSFHISDQLWTYDFSIRFSFKKQKLVSNKDLMSAFSIGEDDQSENVKPGEIPNLKYAKSYNEDTRPAARSLYNRWFPTELKFVQVGQRLNGDGLWQVALYENRNAKPEFGLLFWVKEEFNQIGIKISKGIRAGIKNYELHRLERTQRD